MKKGELQVGRGTVKPLQGLPKSPPLLPTPCEQRNSGALTEAFIQESEAASLPCPCLPHP